MNEYANILQQRRLEASVIRAFYNTLSEAYGAAEAGSIVKDVIRRLAYDKGRELRIVHPDGDLAAIAELWGKLSEGGALEIEYFSNSPDCLHFRVNRCGYAQLYQEMGIGNSLSALLSCERDEALLRGYSDKIVLERSRTILDGAGFCEFVYKPNRGKPEA